MTEKTLYAELTPQEFGERLAAAPIAYLPLGTLEWHGEHLPLGSDGLQSRGFFQRLASEVGGMVLPMLFLGPDRSRPDAAGDLYGMDFCSAREDVKKYPDGQLPGSAYWVGDDLFEQILTAALTQLRRAGFRIVVGHGHGPSTAFFRDHADTWRDKLGLECFICWETGGDRRLGIQTDHAAANETSLLMALRPDLVQMDRLPAVADGWPVAVGGEDPRTEANPALGEQAIALHVARMAGILRDALARLIPT